MTRRWRARSLGRAARPAIVALAIVAIAALLGQAALVMRHPISLGSISTWGTDLGPCAGDELATCYGVAYVPGSRVGMILGITNDGPIAMTIESIQPIDRRCTGCPSPRVVLHPALATNLDVPPATQGFAPVVVQPGETPSS